MAVDQNQLRRESTRLRNTNDDQVTSTTEGRKNASKQSLKRGNAKKRKIATESDARKSDHHRVNSTQITGQRKGVKKKIIRASDGVDKPIPVNQPQRQMPVLARGSTGHPISGDDSDTVVARTPQLHESIGQPRVLQNTLSERSLIPIHRELSFASGREGSPVGRAAKSAKRPLNPIDRQSATNAGEDWTPAPKRRRLARNPQQEINTYNDSTVDVCQSSEPDCAPQLANILSSALAANGSIPGSVNPTGWRSRDTRESGHRSVVHDHERPKQADPRQTSLSFDERGGYEKDINRLTNRLAALEKDLEESKRNTVNLIIPSSPSQPLYCLPIPFGQMEGIIPSPVENRLLKSDFREIGRRFPAQNEVLIQRASNPFLRHQYSQYHHPQFSQFPQFPAAGPNKYPQIYGQSNKNQQPPTSPRLWRIRGEQRPPEGNLNRERHQGNPYQSHGTVGVPEASNSRRLNRWGPPVVKPSNTSRYPRRTVGERERSSQRWSRAPLPSPSRHGEQGAPDGDGERCDNENQHTQKQVATGWGLSDGRESPPIATGRDLSRGWDPPPIGDGATTNENQRAQERVATRWGPSHGWDSSNDAANNETQRAQELVGMGERLSHGWDSPVGNNGATNEEQESQWEDNYVQDDDVVGIKIAMGGEGSDRSWAKDPDSDKTAAVPDVPWVNNPWTS
ncbi:hypothetical protein JOM56_003387 [Amanita muscaria]